MIEGVDIAIPAFLIGATVMYIILDLKGVITKQHSSKNEKRKE